MVKLSILIPSTFDRQQMLETLLEDLYAQIEKAGANKLVEIITDIDDGFLSIGMKRNLMLLKAKGEYVSFIDDDDEVSDEYVPEILNAIKQKPDVIGFLGFMTTNLQRREGFKISKELGYVTIKDLDGNTFYERFNNHLSPIKREIALQIMFPDKRFAEDFEYATKLKNSGLIKTEIFLEKELYHYKYNNKKNV